MSAQELRKAAETLRTLAHAAAGEWHPRDDWYRVHELHSALVGVKTSTNADDDAAYIATMHPGVGLALARWLDDVAAGWMWDGEEPGVVDWDGDRLTLEDSIDLPALALARLINGGVS